MFECNENSPISHIQTSRSLYIDSYGDSKIVLGYSYELGKSCYKVLRGEVVTFRYFTSRSNLTIQYSASCLSLAHSTEALRRRQTIDVLPNHIHPSLPLFFSCVRAVTSRFLILVFQGAWRKNASTFSVITINFIILWKYLLLH